MQLAVIVAAVGLLVALPAMAQQPPIDPRLTGPTVSALQAVLTLREAEMKALAEDFRKREAEWAEYSKSLWQSPVK